MLNYLKYILLKYNYKTRFFFIFFFNFVLINLFRGKLINVKLIKLYYLLVLLKLII